MLKFIESLAHKIIGKSSSKKSPSGYLSWEIKPYQENELGYAYREGFLQNFSSISEEIHFVIKGNAGAIKLYIHAPAKYKNYIENVFYANFPTSDIVLLKTPLGIYGKKMKYLKFSKGSEFYDTSVFSRGDGYVDPFKDILSLYFSIPGGAELSIAYMSCFYVKKAWWQKIFHFLLKMWKGKKATKEDADKEEEKRYKRNQDIKNSGRDVLFAIGYQIKNIQKHERSQKEEDIIHGFDRFLAEGKITSTRTKPKTYTNVNQFVNFFHIPTKDNVNKSLQYIPYRKLPYPVDIPSLKNTSKADITLLGTTDYKTDELTFGVKKEDKFRHIYIVGKTGMGKSTFISNMVRSDMIRDNGLAVVDPHGDLIEDVMAHIPSHRTNDVFIFDVSDTDYPVGFNILECHSPDEKNLIASAVVSIFKKLFAHSWGPRLEYVLRNVMLSILEYPNATLMHVMRMLTDKNFREEVLENVTDPVVMKFWRDEYDKRQEKQKQEAVGPIANKIGQFLSSPVVRNIFAQPKSSLRIRQLMDEGKILLINLSKGKIGEDNASMIGSFLVSKFQIDAMSRADIPYQQRKDFYLYIDEFQNFATDAFESILSEARKYRLSLIVANQYTTQIEENVRNAIFGNVGSIISFGLGYDDATMMSQQFKEIISPNDLLSLPKFTAYAKLMVEGVTSDPFSMKTFPLPAPTASDEIKEKMRKQSRQRYGMPREKLEKLLKVWSEKQFTQAEKIAEKVQAETLASGGKLLTIDDIELGKTYEGYVKLKYNYGLFITVKGVEGLLHKSEILVPKNLENRKDIYMVGDKLSVVAREFKEIKGEKKVVWSQKKG